MFLAKLAKAELISSQQATQLSHDSRELMRVLATTGQVEEPTEVIEQVTPSSLASSPQMSLNDEWTNIENIPIDND